MSNLSRVFLCIGAAITLFFAYVAYMGSTPEGQDRSHERALIDSCHQQQGRASLSPGSVRSVAAVCEKLEDEFRAKWGYSP